MVRRRKRRTSVWAIAIVGVVAAAAVALWPRTHAAPPTLLLPPNCNLGPTVAGIDVSYYQGKITWQLVKRAGAQFAFIRAYDGSDTFDSQFAANWTGAAAAGVLRSAYQYFRPDESPFDQADAFLQVVRAYGPGELPPVLDIETTGGMSLDAVAKNANNWMDRVRRELGVEPLVYTNVGMWRDRPATEVGKQPLWLAHYTTSCPQVPGPWVRWAFWQYTDDGRVPGIDRAVDLDVFDGTLVDLQRRFVAGQRTSSDLP
jgi:lysozyme